MKFSINVGMDFDISVAEFNELLKNETVSSIVNNVASSTETAKVTSEETAKVTSEETAEVTSEETVDENTLLEKVSETEEDVKSEECADCELIKALNTVINIVKDKSSY